MISIIIFSILLALLTHWVYKWSNPKCNGVLPPGSLGLPLIGESLQLFKATGNSLDLAPFFKTRIQRYGKLFRTSVAGKNVVVCCDGKISHDLLKQHGKLVEPWTLGTFGKLFSQDKLSIDNVHTYIRNLGLRNFGVESIRSKLLPQMEEYIQAALINWSRDEHPIDMKNAVGKMALEFSAEKLFGYNPQQAESDKLAELYFGLSNGHVSIPLNIPGTTHHKCVQNHKKASAIIAEIVKNRMDSEDATRNDFLDHLIADMKKEKFVTEEFVNILLFSFLFISFESTATACALALKLVEENPKVLEELIVEHQEIIKKKENPNSLLTWEDYKSMTFTLQVINEVLRLGNISMVMFRKAKQDIPIAGLGYTIPKGWGIIIATSALHMDPETYKDPLSFNPWRWKDNCKTPEMVKNLMPFGAGMKQCAGADYARVFVATFLHVIVTKYQWKTVKGGQFCRTPMINFGKDGMHMEFKAI